MEACRQLVGLCPSSLAPGTLPATVAIDALHEVLEPLLSAGRALAPATALEARSIVGHVATCETCSDRSPIALIEGDVAVFDCSLSTNESGNHAARWAMCHYRASG